MPWSCAHSPRSRCRIDGEFVWRGVGRGAKTGATNIIGAARQSYPVSIAACVSCFTFVAECRALGGESLGTNMIALRRVAGGALGPGADTECLDRGIERQGDGAPAGQRPAGRLPASQCRAMRRSRASLAK